VGFAVGLGAQKRGGGFCRPHRQQVHPNAHALRSQHTGRQICIPRKQQRVGDRFVLGQADEVCDDQSIYRLLIPDAVARTQSELEVVKRFDRLVAEGLAIGPWAVVPINPKQVSVGKLRLRLVDELCAQLRVIDRDALTPGALTMDDVGGLHPKIARIDEDGKPAHTSSIQQEGRHSALLK